MKTARTDSSQTKKLGAVGYGRPPAHTRFKPGQSGNPRGRPSGKKVMRDADPMQSCGELLRKILKERVTLRDGDQDRRVSKLDAILRSLIARAIKGEIRASGKVLELLSATAAPDAQSAERDGITVRFIKPRLSED